MFPLFTCLLLYPHILTQPPATRNQVFSYTVYTAHATRCLAISILTAYMQAHCAKYASVPYVCVCVCVLSSLVNGVCVLVYVCRPSSLNCRHTGRRNSECEVKRKGKRSQNRGWTRATAPGHFVNLICVKFSIYNNYQFKLDNRNILFCT